MAESADIKIALQLLNKVKDFKTISTSCCEELINVVSELVNKIQENSKTIEQLAEEVQNNQKVIEMYENKSKIRYELDEDGFTSLESKKVGDEYGV